MTARSVEFQCPTCGGSNYTTSVMEPMVGQCLGQGEDLLERTCKFEWPRSEDWRYFVMVDRRHFADEAEYEAKWRTYGDK